MPNQIDRDVYVTRDVLKTPIQYVRGTDYLPIVMHFRDFNIPEDASAQVFIAKPSGNIFYGAATISGNDVTIATEEQMFIELGLTLMQISIQDNNKELISFAQPVYVSQNLKSGDLPDSTTDIKFLDQAIQEANEAVDTATTAAQQAAIAVQNANQAIQNANGLISELSEQVSSLNTNYASLVNGVSIPQLNTTLKTVVGALNELNSNILNAGANGNVIYKNINGNSLTGTQYARLNEIVDSLDVAGGQKLYLLYVTIGSCWVVIAQVHDNTYKSYLAFGYYLFESDYLIMGCKQQGGVWTNKKVLTDSIT